MTTMAKSKIAKAKVTKAGVTKAKVQAQAEIRKNINKGAIL